MKISDSYQNHQSSSTYGNQSILMVDGYSIPAVSLHDSNVKNIDYITRREAKIYNQQCSQRVGMSNIGNLNVLAFAAILGNNDA